MVKEKISLKIGKSLIILGLILFFGYLVFSLSISSKDKESIESFISNIDNNSYVFSKKSTNSNYIAVLEIPKINLKRGLYSYNSIYNDIDKNITILESSKMPNKENSTLVLASHSGNSRVSYFKDLNKLQNDNLVIVYYNDVKYFYKIIDFYTEKKNGFITKPDFKSGKYIILTTCWDSLNQLIYIGKLVKEV